MLKEKKMEKKQINVTRSSMPSYKEYCKEIKGLWNSRWLSNRGSEHRKFEEMLCEFLGCDAVALFANGHVALEVMIDSFNFPKGSKVITTPYTHCSTTHAIVRNGLLPVFVDVKKDDFTIDPKKIEEKIDENTVAIVATHVYGFLCDVNAIEKIAKKHKLKVIYDAAHAFGVTKNGVAATSFGDAAMISCHATKVFHTIEGGIGVFRDSDVYKIVDRLTNFGFNGPEQVDHISTNARMNEYEAAMGICNLRHFKDEVKKRQAAAERYWERLDNIKGIKCVKPTSDIEWNYSYFPVLFDGYKYDRNRVQAILAEDKIFARKYFYPLVNELNCYKEEYGKETDALPVAKYAAEHVLTLPMFADLTKEDVDRICDLILK